MRFIDTLWVALQPIVDLQTGIIIGHEALVRGRAGSQWQMPEEIFGHGAETGQEAEVEARCRRLALWAQRMRLHEDQSLFVNVNLQYPLLQLIPDGMPVATARVAIEVSEQHEILRDPEVLELLTSWREAGHLIVQDDYGVGYASLGNILAVHPDMIKLDRFMVAEVDRDRERRLAIASTMKLAFDLGVEVVAEGVETIPEMRVLQDLGVHYAQGFLFGRPAWHAQMGTVAIVHEK